MPASTIKEVRFLRYGNEHPLGAAALGVLVDDGENKNRPEVYQLHHQTFAFVFSNVELERIIELGTNELVGMDPEDTPPAYREILKRLRDVLDERRQKEQAPESSETDIEDASDQ